MNAQKEDLTSRLDNVIRGTCNTVGCDSCGLKWDGGCSATDLQNQLYEIEIQEMNSKDE